MEPTLVGLAEGAALEGLPGVGDVIAGKYRIERVLGRGGMGIVVAAVHTSLGQRVAVKFALPAAARRPGASERFLREARAVAALRSEHVARVIDVGTLDTGLPYFVMEHLIGTDLGKLCLECGPLPVHEVVDHVLQACEAVAEAHAHSIVHRDLKPSNLFLAVGPGGGPSMKVLDFGISKNLEASDEAEGKLTTTGMMLGSPCYMSPEQVRSAKDVDTRTDLWSLGVILYELLTTRLPFETASLSALFASIVTDPPTPPRAVRFDLPADLEAIILRCLEKSLDRRIQTVAELAEALQRFGTEQSRLSARRIARISMSGEATLSPEPPQGVDSQASTLPADAHPLPALAVDEVDTKPPASGGDGERPLHATPHAAPPGDQALVRVGLRRRLALGAGAAALLVAAAMAATRWPRDATQTTAGAPAADAPATDAPAADAPAADALAADAPAADVPAAHWIAPAPSIPVASPPVAASVSAAPGRTHERPPASPPSSSHTRPVPVSPPAPRSLGSAPDRKPGRQLREDR